MIIEDHPGPAELLMENFAIDFQDASFVLFEFEWQIIEIISF